MKQKKITISFFMTITNLLLFVFLSYAQSITIDGYMSDWDESMLFDVPPNQAEEAGDFSLTPNLDIKDIYVTHDEHYLFLRVVISDEGNLSKMAEYQQEGDLWKDLIQIYIDVDISGETGLSYGWLTGGDYYINITDPHGNPGLKTVQRYGILHHTGQGGTDDETWQEIMGDSCLVAVDMVDSTSVEIAIPRSAIGETNGNKETTVLLIRSETPNAWGTDDVAPNSPGVNVNMYYYWLSDGAPLILQQPQSQVKVKGSSAAFSVSAKGKTPFTYEWYLNGSSIAGASEIEYTTPELTMDDDGNTYYCIVSNDVGKDTSETAVLHVKEGSDDADLIHPEWGFTDFAADKVTYVTELTYSNIQNAINTVSDNGGGTVLLSSGTVTITSAILMKSNVKLIGELNSDSSRAVTIIAKKNSTLNEGVIVARSTVSNTTIENLIIDVNKNHIHGIAYIYGPDNFLISNNKIVNVGIEKINANSGENDVPAKQDNPTAINIWSDSNFAEGFTIQNNFISKVAKHGIDVNNGRSFIFKDNYINGCFMGYDASTGSQNAEILKNEVINCLFGAKIIGHSSVNVIVHHNYHHNLDDSPYYWGGEWGYDSGSALVLQGAGTGIEVTDNILSGTTAAKGIAYWDGGQNGAIVKDNITTPSDPLAIEDNSENLMLHPDKFSLFQNYPNPFNPLTKISYNLPQALHVNLTVYNIAGEKIAELVNEKQSAGLYNVDFNGEDLASGIYFYKFQTKYFTDIKRMLLIK